MISARPTVSVFVRHRDSCRSAGNEFYPTCDCAKWLRYSLNGRQHRVAANTRAYSTALKMAQELQKQLDAGLASRPVVAPDGERRTIAEAIETYLTAKETENITARRVKKLRSQLNQFERFMSGRGKFFPSEITAEEPLNSVLAGQTGKAQQGRARSGRGYLARV